jgi:hypothetical protein
VGIHLARVPRGVLFELLGCLVVEGDAGVDLAESRGRARAEPAARIRALQ